MQSTESMDMQSILNQRQTQVTYTTSLFKAYKNTYNSSEIIELSIPPSRQMINLADIIVYFRPIVKYTAWQELTEFQNSQRCLTAINAQNHLTVDSITINNQQILAQPRQNNLYARTILDQYLRTFLKTKPIKSLGVDGVQLTTGYMYQSGSAMNAYNVIESLVVTPANGLYTNPSMEQKENYSLIYPNTGGLLVGNQENVRDRGQNSSNFEGSYFPRATVSQMYNYFYNANIPPSDSQNSFGTSYYEQRVGVNLGNPRKQQDGVASTFPASINDLTFPNLCRAHTVDVNLYRLQQDSFLAYRQRFIQIQVGPYKDPTVKKQYGAKAVVADQFQGYITCEEFKENLGFDNLVSQDNGSIGEEVKTAVGKITKTANLRAMAGKLVDCRFSYGIPIQQQSASDYSRYQGKVWTAADTTLKNPERLTVVGVRLGDISQELEQIGTLAMEKSRVEISLFVNTPECCLSAYLQPSLILDSLNSVGSGPLEITNTNGEAPPTITYKPSQAITGSPQYYKKFLDLCQIGSGIQLSLNDVMARVETHSYSQNAYNIVRDLLNQPKPYQTFRFTNKTISGSGPMTLSLNLGVSSTVRCVFYFIIPRSNKFNHAVVKRPTQTDNALPQDSMVWYSATCPPQRGDLRSTILDSYYINHQSWVMIDNERFDQTDIPLGEPQLNQYLLTTSAIQTALGRYLDIDLNSYVHNRFLGCISIDNTGSRKFISQQLEFTINIDDRDRVQQAEIFNLHNRSISNQFEVILVGVVGQTVVDCQRVMV